MKSLGKQLSDRQRVPQRRLRGRTKATSALLLSGGRWTAHDVALLDDARSYLGPRPSKHGKIDEAEEIRTYGHIVVDEVQDLTPMQMAMVSRRSLYGSLTVVGDIA